MFTELVEFSYYNKVSLVMIVPLFIVFFMCMIDADKTKYLFKSLFSNTYFFRYPYDSVGKISVYQVFVLLFISIVFALFLMILRYDSTYIYEYFLESFASLFWCSVIYFSIKHVVSEICYHLSNKKPWFKQMLTLETSYLTNLSLVICVVLWYVFLHLNHYESAKKTVLLLALIAYCMRFIVLIVNNKKLISGKVLYIILYLCTLEIVPLIYLLKSYTE